MIDELKEFLDKTSEEASNRDAIAISEWVMDIALMLANRSPWDLRHFQQDFIVEATCHLTHKYLARELSEPLKDLLTTEFICSLVRRLRERETCYLAVTVDDYYMGKLQEYRAMPIEQKMRMMREYFEEAFQRVVRQTNQLVLHGQIITLMQGFTLTSRIGDGIFRSPSLQELGIRLQILVQDCAAENVAQGFVAEKCDGLEDYLYQYQHAHSAFVQAWEEYSHLQITSRPSHKPLQYASFPDYASIATMRKGSRKVNA